MVVSYFIFIIMNLIVCCFVLSLFTFITSASPAASKFHTYKVGKYATEEYGIYFRNANTFLSPFHDIPLYADKKNQIFNMVVEIPKCTQHKLEISKHRALNPIVHDIKNGKIRVVDVKYPHNYGAFPQTWEKPSHVDTRTNCSGDNDPIDVVEIGCGVLDPGTVVPVKVLGIFALIDEGELDWKVVAVHVNDDYATTFNNLKDVEKQHPSLLQKMKDWFKNYKGSQKVNEIALNEEIKDQEFAYTIIEETHNFWKELVMCKDIQTDISRENICVEGSPFKKTLQEILKDFPEQLRDGFYTNLHSNSSPSSC